MRNILIYSRDKKKKKKKTSINIIDVKCIYIIVTLIVSRKKKSFNTINVASFEFFQEQCVISYNTRFLCFHNAKSRMIRQL